MVRSGWFCDKAKLGLICLKDLMNLSVGVGVRVDSWFDGNLGRVED